MSSLSGLLFSQEGDYSNYHKLINEAENQFFISRNVDSSLAYYDMAFDRYDFIFVKDLMNAAQIAVYSKKSFEEYILRSFEFGVEIQNFDNFPILKNEAAKMFKKNHIKETIKKNRSIYLEKIDFEYLSWMYDLAINDQLSKSKGDYDKKVNELLGKLAFKINDKGFPGEKIVGIQDSNIFSEIGKPELDFEKKIEECCMPKLSYFKLDEDLLANKLAMLLLVHHKCSYSKLKSVLYEQIKKGNIHPRDVGLLYDNNFHFVNQPSANYCSNNIPENCFLLNVFANYPKKLSDDIEAIDKLRSEFFIVSVEVDRSKKEYEENFGFKLFSGFWNCR